MGRSIEMEGGLVAGEAVAGMGSGCEWAQGCFWE